MQPVHIKSDGVC